MNCKNCFIKTRFIKIKGTAINIIIKPFIIANKRELSLKWQCLETRDKKNIFLSWVWISNWLDLITDKIFIMEAYKGKQVVGLGLFVENTRKVFGFYPVKQWWLHRSGDNKKDQIWIEHNDFLLDSSIENEVRDCMIQALCANKNSIKEVIIGLSSEKVLSSFSRHYKHSNVIINTVGYNVDLSVINTSYIQKIVSKNTRSQIRRSKKLLIQQGELKIQIISDQQKILNLLPNIAKIHINLWENTLEGSGFSNSIFNQFHEELINQNPQIVELAVLSLNDNDLGYLFNFVMNNKVYFYLSAIEKSMDSKIKIGLLLHSEAIQHYFEQGMQCYDFLGGEARYKQSLSNRRYSLAINSFFNNNLILQLEKKLKSIKLTFKLILAK